MGLRATAKRAILPFAKQAVKLYCHDRKVLAAKIRRKMHGNQSNIIEEYAGDLHHEGGKYALFLVWQPKKIAWYVENSLSSLNEAGINVIIIVNHDLSSEQVEYLKQRSHAILVRDNTGFDIGGYRDGTLFLAKGERNPTRVIYMNDSIYYFKKGLTDLFNKLANSASDICGTFENWEIHYHIQSFCFSISGHLFKHEKFQDFWENYLPVNSRLWAINAGEVGLSRSMVPIADSIEIIYKPNGLRDALTSLTSVDDYVDLINLYPTAIRIHYEILEDAPKPAVVQTFISRIGLRSQIHTGGFLYRKYLSCPLMKRDLLYRLQFTADEIEHALIETGHEEHLDEIMADIRKKGSVEYLPLIKKLQAANGIV
ncbi:rhamnan synthesis F family protein [Brucella rhizosphaerae]|uniref:rhamnan synthesis F family protein n=1 Tax=Brucella rhizosphaerae TaxID=571254 RepID=UPI0004661605|nr:rhamnan synthesis F family protein [Brucella rhizosphaerae]